MFLPRFTFTFCGTNNFSIGFELHKFIETKNVFTKFHTRLVFTTFISGVSLNAVRCFYNITHLMWLVAAI
ncbi:hypothetical protein ECSTECMHI813_2855 [Escherichia coli STEC_MHI813]|nr:hypothetical protein ECSTECMHI813_2855 [Escherichia coli STEC_MHI813]